MTTRRTMGTGRLEAFSDGVIAIIITIMVLELKVPHGASPDELRPLLPVFASYVLSFVNVGIYWNNHHHLLQVTERVNGAILWANLHLLFWLSLIPFTAAWLGEHHRDAVPSAGYGIVLLMASIGYQILQRAIIRRQGRQSVLQHAVGDDRKGKLSLMLYLIAVPLAFVRPWLSETIYVAVALVWLMPDRRIERVVAELPDDLPTGREIADTSVDFVR